jgi:hypothetical protein
MSAGESLSEFVSLEAAHEDTAPGFREKNGREKNGMGI